MSLHLLLLCGRVIRRRCCQRPPHRWRGRRLPDLCGCLLLQSLLLFLLLLLLLLLNVLYSTVLLLIVLQLLDGSVQLRLLLWRRTTLWRVIGLLLLR